MDDKRQYSLTGATLVTPTEVLPATELTISGRRIVGRRISDPRIKCSERSSADGRHSDECHSDGTPVTYRLDLRDHLIFPGLINAHDHLNGTWWPRVAPNRPYKNVYRWLDDLHTSPVRYDRQRNTIEDIYELGMYRNLISGVTTVADHFWRINGPEFYTRFPINVLFEYGRTWTPREPTGWGDDIPTEYNRAVRAGQPYVIHLAEGVDKATAQEMDVLLKEGALGRNTLIVHGISLRPQDMQAMAEVGASVCWCPSSNLYLYERTADIPALLEAGINVTLGTDSSLSGGLNLLDELRTARHVLQDVAGATRADRSYARWLIESVTTRAAYALLGEARRGRIAPGFDADLLVLPDRAKDPYTTLIDAQVGDIALLICAGVPIYGDPQYRPLFEWLTPSFTSVIVRNHLVSKPKLLAGDPLALLERLSKATARAVELPFLPLTAPPSQTLNTDTDRLRTGSAAAAAEERSA